jgi:hypothetical protein
MTETLATLLTAATDVMTDNGLWPIVAAGAVVGLTRRLIIAVRAITR